MKTREQILSELVFNCRWASWLPFSWLQNIAARYYAQKAERIYKDQIDIILRKMSRAALLAARAPECSQIRLMRLLSSYANQLNPGRNLSFMDRNYKCLFIGGPLHGQERIIVPGNNRYIYAGLPPISLSDRYDMPSSTREATKETIYHRCIEDPTIFILSE